MQQLCKDGVANFLEPSTSCAKLAACAVKSGLSTAGTIALAVILPTAFLATIIAGVHYFRIHKARLGKGTGASGAGTSTSQVELASLNKGVMPPWTGSTEVAQADGMYVI